MGNSGRPDFVGDHWLGYRQGLSFASDSPTDLASNSNLRGSEWMRLLCVFAQAQRGKFDNVPVLCELLAHSADADVRASAARLVGHFAPSTLRPALAHSMFDENADVRDSSIISAFYSCDLGLVDALLKARRVLSGEDAEWAMSALNLILEDETNLQPQLLGISFPSDDAYEALARAIRDEVAASVGLGKPVLGGRLLSVGSVLTIIKDICRSEDAYDDAGPLSYMLDVFEAMTGVPSNGMFEEDLVPQILKILTVVEEFECGSEIEQYQPGTRYFFGHPLSD